MSVEGDLRKLAAQLEELGLSNGSDFRVEGVRPPGPPGSEYVGLWTTGDGQFEVFHLDMGQEYRKLLTPSFQQARALFIDEAVKLARHHRRGPLAEDPDPSTPWNEAMGIFLNAQGDSDSHSR